MFGGYICNGMEWIFTLNEIDLTASKILAYLQTAASKTIALFGQMGAGKTTFVTAIARALGSKDATGSPTFSIINQYKDANNEPIFHMDWYRLKDEEEGLQAGIEDPMFCGAWCFIEWPERLEQLLPDHCIRFKIEALDTETRRIYLLA